MRRRLSCCWSMAPSSIFPTIRDITPIMAAAGLGSVDADTRGLYTTFDVQQRSIDSLELLLKAGADINAAGRTQAADSARRGCVLGMERRGSVPVRSRRKARREGFRRHVADRFRARAKRAATAAAASASTCTRTPRRCSENSPRSKLLLHLIDVHIQRVADPEPDDPIRVDLALRQARLLPCR